MLLVPKSSDSESAHVKEENLRLAKALAAMENQHRESNRRFDEVSKQLTESLGGNKELHEQIKDLQAKLDILIVCWRRSNCA